MAIRGGEQREGREVVTILITVLLYGYGVAVIACGAIALNDALRARREIERARRPQPLPRAEVRRG